MAEKGHKNKLRGTSEHSEIQSTPAKCCWRSCKLHLSAMSTMHVHTHYEEQSAHAFTALQTGGQSLHVDEK